MSDPSYWRILFYLLSIMAVVFFAVAGSAKFRANKRAIYAKKTFWVILIACAGYWFATIPFVGRYYDSSLKSDYPAKLTSQEGEVQYIKEHQQRIEDLETEVKDTKEELKALEEHYQIIIQLFFYAVLFRGFNQIFNLNNKDPEVVEKDKVSNL